MKQTSPDTFLQSICIAGFWHRAGLPDDPAFSGNCPEALTFLPSLSSCGSQMVSMTVKRREAFSAAPRLISESLMGTVKAGIKELTGKPANPLERMIRDRHTIFRGGTVEKHRKNRLPAIKQEQGCFRHLQQMRETPLFL